MFHELVRSNCLGPDYYLLSVENVLFFLSSVGDYGTMGLR